MSYYENEFFDVLPSGLRRMRGYGGVNKKIEEKKLELRREIKNLEMADNVVRSNKNIRNKSNNDIGKIIKKLNDRFIELNERIRKEFEKLYEEGRKRVLDKDDWVMDFEIELELEYILGENDPDFDDVGYYNTIGGYRDWMSYNSYSGKSYREIAEEDYKETVLKYLALDWVREIEPEKRCHHNCSYSDAFNHDTIHKADEEIKNLWHTYFLHDLYEHQVLKFDEIARIVDITMKMQIIYQNYDNGIFFK